MTIYTIPHPRVGDVHVRMIQDGTYQECTPGGRLVLSAEPFYRGLSQSQVFQLGGKAVA